MIGKLQSEYGIESAVNIVEGNGRMPMICMDHGSGSHAEVYLHGAHVTAWNCANGKAMLFLSKESKFEPGCAIRGGIPIVFPQFGDGVLPKHGFARNMDWMLVDSSLTDDGKVLVILQLTDSQSTRKIWNHHFNMQTEIVLSDHDLLLKPSISNPGDDIFTFQFVFHTYFSTPDIRKTSVTGLKGIKYKDALKGMSEFVEQEENVRFVAETDRVYINAPDSLLIEHDDEGILASIKKSNMPDVVVWNPWIGKSKRLSDFGDDEYLQMVCVETGVIESPICLCPGDSWAGETLLSAENG